MAHMRQVLAANPEARIYLQPEGSDDFNTWDYEVSRRGLQLANVAVGGLWPSGR